MELLQLRAQHTANDVFAGFGVCHGHYLPNRFVDTRVTGD